MNQRFGLLAFAASLAVIVAGCALTAEGQPPAPLADTSAPAKAGTASAPDQKSTSANPAASASKPSGEAAPPPQTAGSEVLKGATLGGKFFWSDELVYYDWRIQRYADNGHCRLIDGEGTRHASGTFDECLARFNAIKLERKLPPLEGKVVLVLHGLIRTRTSSSNMVEFLRENSKFTPLSVGYASTQADVATHARTLASVIDHLGDKVEEIDFVAHSLGNLVIRHYLGDHTDAKTGRHPDPRIKRIVMVGPPNNGARMAEIFGNNTLFERLVGRSGRAMASEWHDLQRHLAIPQVEFGIIAGGRLNDDGYNPLLAGDDDLILAVDETKLPGARDFLVVEGVHAMMMSNPDIQKAALTFLEHGYFVSEDKRHPLPIPER